MHTSFAKQNLGKQDRRAGLRHTRDTGIQWGKVSEGDGSRYRYISDDDPVTQSPDGYQVIASNRASSSVVLYANGKAVSQTRSSNNASTERTYFGTDLLGTVRSATRDSGTAQYYNYALHLFRSRRRETKRIISDSCSLLSRPRKRTGVFGKPLGENISDFAYTGKPYDPTTGMYNYGYRDYSPQTARFTTVDPIRDGSNWFVYCNNEPVNFVDAWGLEAGDGSVRYFTQQEWDGLEGVNENFWADACAVTSLLNELSEEFTTQSGKTLSLKKAQKMIQEAVRQENIREDARIKSWENAANQMWKVTELEGSWTYEETSGKITDHSIYNVFSKGQVAKGENVPGVAGQHFVNSTPDGYYETYGGGGAIPQTPTQIANKNKLQELWRQTIKSGFIPYIPYVPSKKKSEPSSDNRQLSEVKSIRNLEFKK